MLIIAPPICQLPKLPSIIQPQLIAQLTIINHMLLRQTIGSLQMLSMCTGLCHATYFGYVWELDLGLDRTFESNWIKSTRLDPNRIERFFLC